MRTQPILTGILLLLGGGFFVANARLLIEYSQYRQRRALLTWRSPRPPYYGVALGIGVVLGVLVLYKIFVLHMQAFGETMMFVYYAYLVPLSQRIGRGFYEDGIRADSSFIPYHDVGGVSWREGEKQVTLIVSSRLRNFARRLVVPGDKYRAAKRLLTEKIGENKSHFAGTALDLSDHDDEATHRDK
jgi:hypothetical protein